MIYLGLHLRDLKVLLILKNPFEEKSIHLIKKLKVLFKCLKNLKIVPKKKKKKHFSQKLKNKTFTSKAFFYLNALFLKHNFKHALRIVILMELSFLKLRHSNSYSKCL
jgi:hypothetical protein